MLCVGQGLSISSRPTTFSISQTLGPFTTVEDLSFVAVIAASELHADRKTYLSGCAAEIVYAERITKRSALRAAPWLAQMTTPCQIAMPSIYHNAQQWLAENEASSES